MFACKAERVLGATPYDLRACECQLLISPSRQRAKQPSHVHADRALSADRI